MTEDTVERKLESGKLRTIRFLTKAGGRVPRWAESFVPSKMVAIIEESVVDPIEKSLTTYTRNIGYSNVIVSRMMINFTRYLFATVAYCLLRF